MAPFTLVSRSVRPWCARRMTSCTFFARRWQHSSAVASPISVITTWESGKLADRIVPCHVPGARPRSRGFAATPCSCNTTLRCSRVQTIEEAETGARVVQLVVDACVRAEPPKILMVATQALPPLGLVRHPFKGHQRHPLFWVAAPTFEWNACNRTWWSGLRERFTGVSRSGQVVGGFVPQHRPERHAWLVDRQRLAGVVDAPGSSSGSGT